MKNKTPEDLRSAADGFDISGPQYATLSALLRDAASELENCRANHGHCNHRAAVAAVQPDDGLPIHARACPDCDDQD